MRRSLRRGLLLFASLLVGLAAAAIWRAPELDVWRWYVRAGTPVMTAEPVTLVGSLQWFDDYYAVADLRGGDYAIGEPKYGQCNFSYLIVGAELAILFDTGPGLRNIRPVVERLTALPITAYPSHLHFDHVGNLGRFDHVALPDLAELRGQVRDGRFELGFEQILGFVEGFNAPAFTVTEWVAPGSQVDLGGRQLTLLSVPGHTPDSVALLDRQSHRLFAGDFIYPLDVYAQLPGANLREYARSAGQVLEELDNTTTVFAGHGCDRLPQVAVPTLGRADVAALQNALGAAAAGRTTAETGIYPRRIPVNERMTLLAKYSWMSP